MTASEVRYVLKLSEQERDRHLRRVQSVINGDADSRFQVLICAETLRDLLNTMRPAEAT